MNTIRKTYALGQAIWLDYIRRSFLTSGDLQELIDQGIAGMTSNPTIFEKAITGSSDYDDDLIRLAGSGSSVDDIYDELTRQDIAMAADLFRPVYDDTDGADGFVSLEVNPLLADDTTSTVGEGLRLFRTLDRPNVMIKVPATPEGIPAIEALIADGVNVNVTLIFSLEQYEEAAHAYIRGLKKRLDGGGQISGIASVASFFVSRVDTVVDERLEEMELEDPQGKTAIANAKLAYARFREIFSGPEWDRLQAEGARVQRPLWASTGTKNPAYPDTLYVDTLIGEHTVNTLPPATLHAFMDHGSPEPTLDRDIESAVGHLEQVRSLGIDMAAVTGTLLEKGVESFSDSFRSLMAGIESKRDQLLRHAEPLLLHLGEDRGLYDQAIRHLRDDRIVARIWDHDHTVWAPSPAEITNRLGWLDSPANMTGVVPQIQDFVAHVREAGYSRVLLLGMGGSSLAPEVFRETFGVADGYPDLTVLDSTDPAAVLWHAESHDPARTLHIVSTKSGTTVETLSLFRFFYNRTADAVGRENAGDHFIAITDPGSPLETMAFEHGFRHTFLNDPNIGGRYSALSYFGLVPAALVGVDIGRLLDNSATLVCNCEPSNCPVAGDNTGARLGAAIGVLAGNRVDKLTLMTSPAIASFGAWLEQLLAESTGKDGKGILPVEGEMPGDPEAYGPDRLFVYLRLNGDDTHDAAAAALEAAGRPVIRINLGDIYDLGGEFFRWEMATAVAGHLMTINPFDQPNVESAKVQARGMLQRFREEGALPEADPALVEDRITVFADRVSADITGTLNGFLDGGEPGAYVSLQAYINPASESASALNELRLAIRDSRRTAVTLGFGPRFLHSTGQLHKGDAGRGLFVQITADDAVDLPIPDAAGSEASSITFGTLKAAQALGDGQALREAGRRVIRFHLAGDPAAGIGRLAEAVR